MAQEKVEIIIDLIDNVSKRLDDLNKRTVATFDKITASIEKQNKIFTTVSRQFSRTSEQLKELSDTFKQFHSTLERQRLGLQRTRSAWRGLVWTIVRAEIVYRGIMRIVRAYYDTIAGGIKRFEEYKVTLMSLAAIETSRIGTVIKSRQELTRFYDYAISRYTEFYRIMQEIAAVTPLTTQQVVKLTQTLLAYGQNIDLNNQRVREGIISLANAIAILTQGQRVNLQIMQETRALLTGVGIQFSELYKTIIKTNPELEQQLKIWIREGTVLEHLPKVLSGFNIAAKDFMETVRGQWTTLKSLVDYFIRIPVFSEFNKFLVQTIKNLKDMLFVWDENHTKVVGLSAAGRDLKQAFELLTASAKAFINTLIFVGSHLKTIITLLATFLAMWKAQAILSVFRSIRVAAGNLIQVIAGLVIGLRNLSSLFAEISVGGVVGALVLLAFHFKQVKQIIVEFKDALFGWFSGLAGAIKKLGDEIINVLAGVNKSIDDVVASITDKDIKEVMEEVGWTELGDQFSKPIENVKYSMSEWLNEWSAVASAIQRDLSYWQSTLSGFSFMKIPEDVKAITGLQEITAAIRDTTAKINELREKAVSLAGEDRAEAERKLQILEGQLGVYRNIEAVYKQIVEIAKEERQLKWEKDFANIEERRLQLEQRLIEQRKRERLAAIGTLDDIKRLYKTDEERLKAISKWERDRIRIITESYDKEIELAKKLYAIRIGELDIERTHLLNIARRFNLLAETARSEQERLKFQRLASEYLHKAAVLQAKITTLEQERKLTVDALVAKKNEEVNRTKQVAETNLQAIKKSNDALEKQKRKIEEINKKWQSFRDELTDVAGYVTNQMIRGFERLRDAIADSLYNVFTGNIRKMSDVWRNFIQYMIHSWLRMVATIAANAIVVKIIGKPTVETAKSLVTQGFSLGGIIQGLGKGLESFFSLPLKALQWVAGTVFKSTSLANTIAGWLKSPIANAVSAGLMTGVFNFISSGDWKKSLGSAIGSAAGYGLGSALGSAIGVSFGGPIGAALGGLLGGAIGGLFGHHHRKKPRFYVFKDTVTFDIATFYRAYERGTESLYRLLRTDVDHTKHSSRAARNIAKTVGKFLKSLLDPWEEWIKQIDSVLNNDLVNKFHHLRLKFYQVKRKSRKHLQEKFESWLKKEFPKVVELQLMTFATTIFEPFITSRAKFEEWLNAWKTKVKKAKSSELNKVLQEFQTEVNTMLSFIDSMKNFLRNMAGELVASIASVLQEGEKAFEDMAKKGIMPTGVAEGISKSIQLQLTMMLSNVFGFLPDWEVQITRFKYLYQDVWNALKESNATWGDLLYIVTHFADNWEYLKFLAEESGVAVETFIGELGNLSYALYQAAQATMQFYSTLESSGIISTTEYLQLMAQQIAAEMSALGVSWEDLGIESPVEWLLSLSKEQIREYVIDAMDLGEIPAEWQAVITDIIKLKDIQEKSAKEIVQDFEKAANIAKTLANKIEDLFLGMQSPLSIFEQFTYAQAKYRRLYEAALTGGEEQVQEYLGFIDTYLGLAQQVMSYQDYYTTFYKVIGDIRDIQDRYLSMADYMESIDESVGSILGILEDWQNNNYGAASGVTLEDVITSVTDIMSDIFSTSADWLADATGYVIGEVEDVATQAVTNIEDAFENVRKILGGIKIDWEAISHYGGWGGFAGEDIGPIYVQSGGVINKPSLAVVAEGTRPEAVIPLPYGERTMDVLFSELAGLKQDVASLYLLLSGELDEIKKINFEMATDVRKMRRIDEKWDVEGIPPTRSE